MKIQILLALLSSVSCLEKKEKQEATLHSKYPSVELKSASFRKDPHTYSLKTEMGNKRVLVTGKFITEEKNCYFQLTMNERESGQLVRLANKLKFC